MPWGKTKQGKAVRCQQYCGRPRGAQTAETTGGQLGRWLSGPSPVHPRLLKPEGPMSAWGLLRASPT